MHVTNVKTYTVQSTTSIYNFYSLNYKKQIVTTDASLTDLTRKPS